jgi:putative transcriptional regulator
MRIAKFSLRGLCLIAFALVTAGWSQPAPSAGTGGGLLLVASPRMDGPFHRTVLVAVPVSEGRHAGFIINRPTGQSLASLFPEHAPSKKVTVPVYFGGPTMIDAVFAVVRSNDDRVGGAKTLLPGLLVVADAESIDKIIEQSPNEARYYVGLVVWEPGELDAEIAGGYWHVLRPDPDLLFRKDTRGMWEELIRRALATTASAPTRNGRSSFA